MRKAKPKNTTKATPKKGERFLAALRKTGNVTQAAKAERVDRVTAYTWRNNDEEFAKQWDEALEEATDLLELEARRRAQDGTPEPVYHRGQQVGTVQKYSDTLLIFLLKAHRPNKFKDRVDMTSNNETIRFTLNIGEKHVPDE